MVLNIYNSLSRTVEEFKPQSNDSVSLYTCGPTVYNYPHIGNYRAYLFGDVLKRTFMALGFSVNHIMNITDIDDKTIRDSIKEGKNLLDFTDFYTQEFFKDRDALGILPATKYTKATDHIQEMVLLIEVLLQKKYAYCTPDGSVYFSISHDNDYGKLSRIDIHSLKENASGRLMQDEYEKENATDFVLWKAWDENDGDVFWETSLGKGRPGWHIECSAMSMKYLGTTIDIHTGGIDNMFPHHENEIAQSESVTEKPFVNYFLHNEHLMVDGKKMSKSAGNFYTLRDIIDKGFNPLTFRYFSFLTHYRTPLNFTWEALTAAGNALDSIQTFYALNYTTDTVHIHEPSREAFLEALANDLNTPLAVAQIFSVMHSKDLTEEVKIGTLTYFDSVLGLNITACITEITPEVEKIIEKRNIARNNKDYTESDILRSQLEALNLRVFDTKDGTKVVKKQHSA
jgi:cysteinyl-tRNA synthetase